MIPDKVYAIFYNLLPMVLLFSVVISIIRITSLVYAKEKIILYKEMKSLVYIIYIFALFYLVTTTDFESFSNNFIPFKEMTRYRLTSPLFYRNVIGNILLFLPFGYLVTDMITEKAKKCPILIVGVITLITSFTTEVIQMKIGRSFDIDDLILNVIGGLLGVIGYKIFHRLLKCIPESWPINWIKFFIFIGGICILFMGYTWLCEVI